MSATDELPDAELIARMQAGDDDAFGVLFDRHLGVLRAKVRRIVSRRLERRVSLADVVQEARIVAHGQMTEFRASDPKALRAWLLQIVELKARETFRHHVATAKRDVGREVSRDARGSNDARPAPIATPSQDAVARELVDAARRAMEELPQDYRHVLHLARVEGLTLGEAAERMGRSREATKKLYARALASFTRKLASAPGGFDGT